jgi:hypothetical protein
MPPEDSGPRSATPPKGAFYAAFAAAVAFYLLFIARTSFLVQGTRYFVLFEDAMISMRYARNFANGNGLNWNAGETPVEGYTNLLWTLWMSFFHKLGISEPKISLAIMLTGVAILVANALVVRRIAAKISLAAWAPLVATVATLFDYPLVFWTLRGMEVGALTLVLDALLLVALEIEDRFTMGRAFAMAILAAAGVALRSDAVIAIGTISLYTLVFAEKRARVSLVVLLGAVVGSVVVGQGLFRRGYYHETLPNTYYLKLNGIGIGARLKRGLFVVPDVLAFHLAVPIAATCGALLSGARTAFWKDKETRRIALLGAVAVLQTAYAVYVGGDAWEWMLYTNRYMTAVMPAFIVVSTALVARMMAAFATEPARAERAARIFGFTLAALGGVLLVLNAWGKALPEVGVAKTIMFSKQTSAAGVILTGAGLAFFATAVRKEAARALTRAAEALASPERMVFASAFLALLVWAPAHLQALARWGTGNAAQFEDEARYARLGLLLKTATPPDFRIAVVAAGATPYFADRPTEDMLGKSDAVIAKEKPRGVFAPGHDKWDYRYTFGERHPALIVELVDHTPEDDAFIASQGYRELPNGLLLRAGTRGIDPAILGAPFETDAEVDELLARAGGHEGAGTTRVTGSTQESAP